MPRRTTQVWAPLLSLMAIKRVAKSSLPAARRAARRFRIQRTSAGESIFGSSFLQLEKNTSEQTAEPADEDKHKKDKKRKTKKKNRRIRRECEECVRVVRNAANHVPVPSRIFAAHLYESMETVVSCHSHPSDQLTYESAKPPAIARRPTAKPAHMRNFALARFCAR